MEDDKQEIIGAMYAQDEENDEPQEQPIQLRLAGKATVINYGGQQIPIPKIEYIERLEAVVREQQKIIDEQRARLKRMELNLNRLMNNANRRITAVESAVSTLQNKRPWE
jgi:hypothetical protein